MSRVIRSRKVKVGSRARRVGAGNGPSASWLEQRAVLEAQAGAVAPRFEVDPFWPKPMPNNWVMGMTIGIGIDERIKCGSSIAATTPGNLDRTELAVVQAGTPRAR